MRGAEPAARGAWGPVRAVVLGEVTTRLLDVADALEPVTAHYLLDLVPGRRPWRVDRPIPQVVSPDLAFGVDCHVPAGASGQVRTVGLVSAHAVLTGGHVLQGSATARIVPNANTHTPEWSHYTARPGVLEVGPKTAPDGIVAGFLDAGAGRELLNLAGISGQVVDRVLRKDLRVERARIPTQPLRLRWNAVLRDDLEAPSADFVAGDGGLLLVSVQARDAHLAMVERFCEDLALHVWMLSSVTRAFERSSRLLDKADLLARILEYLGHLWGPGTYVDEEVDYLWASVEAAWHLSLTWQRQMERLRDRIALMTLKALQVHSQSSRSEHPL